MEYRSINDNPFETLNPDLLKTITRRVNEEKDVKVFSPEELDFIVENDAKENGISKEDYIERVLTVYIYGKFCTDAIAEGYNASSKGMMKYFHERFRAGQKETKTR